MLRRLILISTLAVAATAQVNPQLYSGLQWRLIGPYRGGKATAVSGVPGNPAIFYMGTAGSGAWKTSDGARTWQNVTDGVRLTGIGAVAVAPSKPDVVYVGASGQAERNGLYRSTDAGASFRLVAFDGHTVASIWIDPHNPDLVVAAGDSGLLRTTDGGNSWTTAVDLPGAVAVAAAQDDDTVLYAGFRRGRGGRIAAADTQADPAVYRSADQGATWTALPDAGLPERGRGTIALAVAPGSHGDLLYVYIAQGVFRSNDGGKSWTRTTTDPRLIGGGQFHNLTVDPVHPDILYATQTSFYRSTDQGATWESFTGAPSGDDFNFFWIDPTNPLSMALAVDQGTEVSLNGGHSWTTWYNQPTAQLYNVTTDQRFPFFMYSSQQDSGTVAVPIRGNDGEITYRDWYTTNGFESARITPDPAHANILYVTGWYGSILRVDHTTGQTSHIFERNSHYREAGSPPMEFSPHDPNTLYLGTQYLLRTRDEGRHWETLSPDLTVGAATPALPGRGGRGGGAAISTIAFSPQDAQRIWVGTSNGEIQLSADGGKTWQNRTPTGVTGGITMLEPGHASPAVAYAAIAGRGGFGRGAAPAPPSIYRTADSGQSWQPLAEGLPAGQVHAVREDPTNPRLLFVAMDSGVYVSFDTGAHWQSLELNLPNASARDLRIEQGHLIVATYGRGLWSLDDIGSLRQMSASIASEPAHFFRPSNAIRLQWDTYTDTPINPETPTSENPPDGAILDYYLSAPSNSPLKLAIYDNKGNLVREYSSQGPASLPYKINVPDYWLAPPALLPNHAGLNRFVWNLRYPDPPYLLYTYFGVHTDYYEYTLADHAIPHNTPWHEPQGPMVVPGQYVAKLTVDGKTYTHPLTVTLDPRLTTITTPDLQAQLATAQELVRGLQDTVSDFNLAQDSLKQPGADQEKIQASMTAIGNIDRDQARILVAVTQADAAPGQEILQTVRELCDHLNTAIASWNTTKPAGSPSMHPQACAAYDEGTHKP